MTPKETAHRQGEDAPEETQEANFGFSTALEFMQEEKSKVSRRFWEGRQYIKYDEDGEDKAFYVVSNVDMVKAPYHFNNEDILAKDWYVQTEDENTEADEKDLDTESGDKSHSGQEISSDTQAQELNK